MSETMPQGPVGVADLGPVARRKEQRAWYWYDWANSAYVTTTAAVLFSPYLTSVAEVAACGKAGTSDSPCTNDLSVLGLSVSPGSLVFYLVTIATILSALILPVVGAVADRSGRKKNLMGTFAWAGSLSAALMFFVTGANWQLGALLLLVATLCLGASLVVYDAILCEIATPDERDRVSSRGWALGYLGGGLLLALNFGLLKATDNSLFSVRLCLLSAGLWWAAFTLIPFLGVHNRPARNLEPESGSLIRQSFGQLRQTLLHVRNYPITLTFLVAYLFYNDGIQTVIFASSVYGEKQLGFEKAQVLQAFLIVQFIGILGALAFGKVAARVGSRRVILGGLLVWMLVVAAAYFTPEKNYGVFLLLAVGIGIVLGGTQALSRSFYSLLIPRGREAEYFSLYQAAERGTSWLGTLVFGLVHQLTNSYRPAIFALVLFFLVGVVLLARVDPARGIREAGNTAPAVV